MALIRLPLTVGFTLSESDSAVAAAASTTASATTASNDVCGFTLDSGEKDTKPKSFPFVELSVRPLLQQALFRWCSIDVPIMVVPGCLTDLWVRISCQVYNAASDFAALCAAVELLCAPTRVQLFQGKDLQWVETEAARRRAELRVPMQLRAKQLEPLFRTESAETKSLSSAQQQQQQAVGPAVAKASPSARL